MATAHTPKNDHVAQPVTLSPEQFQAMMDSDRSPPVRATFQDDGPDFPNVSSVSVKLPTFWIHDPDLWFLQTESVFATRTPKVTRDQTKFDHVVTALPFEALNIRRRQRINMIS